MKLWRKYSDKLGFFPDGAFQDYANAGQILVAYSDKKDLLGYLLFRHSKGATVIVHLCVDPAARDTGIAKELVNRLKEISADSRGISLKCRRDYNLQGFWAGLGFVAVNEVKGRGKDEGLLTVWWMDFGHPDLLVNASKERLLEKTCLVIDANVFYGLYSDDKNDEESKALIADWLPDDIELCLTDEIFNEIDRRDSPAERRKNRHLARSFESIPASSRWKTIESELINLLPTFKKSQSGRSDIRHLAKAIAGEALYFITRDHNLLNYSDDVFDKFQISVLRPCELVLQLDHIERGYEYQPARLSGSRYKLRRIRSGEFAAYVDKFVCSAKGERARDFQNHLAAGLANPRVSACYVLEAPTGETHALFITQTVAVEINVPVFRIARTPLSATIGRHILRRLSLGAAREQKVFISISDGFIDERLSNTLANDGYILTSGCYTKVLLNDVIEVVSLDDCLSAMASRYREKAGAVQAIREKVALAITSKNDVDLLAIERILWPAKILGANIPCFIVSIKPQWAKQLFDEQMASEDLFGSSDLIFNAELVYYRARRPSGLRAPARIFWYVSHDKSYHQSGGIRAISILEEVAIGKPKDLYSRYRRLGVYQWKDVIETVNNNFDRELMALRFSNTHMVDNPLEWKALQAKLKKFGIKTMLQSPLKIDENVFAAIVKKTLSPEKKGI